MVLSSCNGKNSPMAMADWISKLDDFLKLSDREVLDHVGKISHQDAKEKAETELEAYIEPVLLHFRNLSMTTFLNPLMN